MNPVTFNDKFLRALAVHPESSRVEKLFAQWQVAPLFDYETTWEKEISLTPHGTAIGEIKVAPWPFETFRLAVTERNVPQDENNPHTAFDTYKTHLVVRRRADGEMHMLIFWRTLGFSTRDADAMLHVYTYTKSGGESGCSASIYAPRRGWQTNLGNGAEQAVSIMAGSAVASFGSFIIDAMIPTNQVTEVRPNQPGRSVQWLQARTHYTLITHGHPANNAAVQTLARVTSDNTTELSRLAHNRREHKRTYRHARFTYARGKTITVRAAWIGPKEWMDAGGKQIYKILEPVP
jgi:hypothetical protein